MLNIRQKDYKVGVRVVIVIKNCHNSNQKGGILI